MHQEEEVCADYSGDMKGKPKPLPSGTTAVRRGELGADLVQVNRMPWTTSAISKGVSEELLAQVGPVIALEARGVDVAVEATEEAREECRLPGADLVPERESPLEGRETARARKPSPWWRAWRTISNSRGTHKHATDGVRCSRPRFGRSCWCRGWAESLL
mmetsp:Transcript_114753/g.244883  ORF Transcript_114753/g.244883 Transcript_114753/m.244883 type:complete len:160 (+) Transcript_114753:274-753(+)